MKKILLMVLVSAVSITISGCSTNKYEISDERKKCLDNAEKLEKERKAKGIAKPAGEYTIC